MFEQSNFRKSENTVLMTPSSSVIKNPYKNNVLMDDVMTNKHFSHYKGNCQIRKTKGNCQIRKTKGNHVIFFVSFQQILCILFLFLFLAPCIESSSIPEEVTKFLR